jgi:hypothetical protein
MTKLDELMVLTAIPADRMTQIESDQFGQLCLELAPDLAMELLKLKTDLPNQPLISEAGMVEVMKDAIARAGGVYPFAEYHNAAPNLIYLITSGQRTSCPSIYGNLGYEKVVCWRKGIVV